MSKGTNLLTLKVKESVPLGQRFGKAEEMAKLIVFLLSEESSYTTGAVYTADGGYAL